MPDICSSSARATRSCFNWSNASEVISAADRLLDKNWIYGQSQGHTSIPRRLKEVLYASMDAGANAFQLEISISMNPFIPHQSTAGRRKEKLKTARWTTLRSEMCNATNGRGSVRNRVKPSHQSPEVATGNEAFDTAGLVRQRVRSPAIRPRHKFRNHLPF